MPKDNSYHKGRSYEDSLSSYGKRQPGSGSSWSAKEDILGEGIFSSYLFQAKNCSGNASHSIKLEDLTNLKKNSSKVGRTGVYIFNFGNGQEYVTIRKKDFDCMVEILEAPEDQHSVACDCTCSENR